MSPEDLVALFHNGPVSDRFARVCRTVTVSAQLLDDLDLPRARTIVGLAGKKGEARDRIVQTAYSAVIRKVA